MFFRNLFVSLLCLLALSACSVRTSPSLFLKDGVKFYKGAAIEKLDCDQLREQVYIVFALAGNMERQVIKQKKAKNKDQKKLKDAKVALAFLLKVYKKSIQVRVDRCGPMPASFDKFKRENPTPSIP